MPNIGSFVKFTTVSESPVGGARTWDHSGYSLNNLPSSACDAGSPNGYVYSILSASTNSNTITLKTPSGVSLPAGALVTGIFLKIQNYSSSNFSNTSDLIIQLGIDGIGLIGNNKANLGSESGWQRLVWADIYYPSDPGSPIPDSNSNLLGYWGVSPVDQETLSSDISKLTVDIQATEGAGLVGPALAEISCVEVLVFYEIPPFTPTITGFISGDQVCSSNILPNTITLDRDDDSGTTFKWLESSNLGSSPSDPDTDPTTYDTGQTGLSYNTNRDNSGQPPASLGGQSLFKKVQVEATPSGGGDPTYSNVIEIEILPPADKPIIAPASGSSDTGFEGQVQIEADLTVLPGAWTGIILYWEYFDGSLWQPAASGVNPYIPPRRGAADSDVNRLYRCYATGNTTAGLCRSATSDSFPVTIHRTPAIGGLTSGCEDPGVVLSVPRSYTGTSIVYTWFRNSINQGTGTTFVATQSGAWVVEVNIDGATDTSSVHTITLNTNPVPTITLTGGTNPVCEGSSITLSTASPYNSYDWRNELGEQIGTSQQITVVPIDRGGGTETFTVTVVDSNGCSGEGTYIATITATTKPILSISCVSPVHPNTVDIVSSTGGGYTNYDFYEATLGLVQTGASNTYNATASGVYTVIATEPGGCPTQESDAITVTITDPSVSGAILGCNGVLHTLSFSGSSGYFDYSSIIWEEFTGTWNQVGTGASYSFTESTGPFPIVRSFRVKADAQVTTSDECQFVSAQFDITFNDLPTPSIVGGSPQVGCSASGLTLQETSGAGGYVDYAWFKDGVDQTALGNAPNDFEWPVFESGTYRVEVQDSTTTCYGVSSNVVVIINATPTPVIDLSTAPTLTITDSNYSGGYPGGTTYQWEQSPNGIDTWTPAGATATIVATPDIYYRVTVTLPVSYGSCAGLSTVDVFTCTILNCDDLVVPSILIDNCNTAFAEFVGVGVTSGTITDGPYTTPATFLAGDAIDDGTGGPFTACKIDVPASFGANNLIATKTVAFDASRGDTILLWMKSSTGVTEGDISIQIDDTAQCASPYASMLVPTMAANEWTLLQLPYPTPASTLNIISLGVFQIVDNGSPYSLYIDIIGLLNGTPEQTQFLTTDTITFYNQMVQSLGCSGNLTFSWDLGYVTEPFPDTRPHLMFPEQRGYACGEDSTENEEDHLEFCPCEFESFHGYGGTLVSIVPDGSQAYLPTHGTSPDALPHPNTEGIQYLSPASFLLGSLAFTSLDTAQGSIVSGVLTSSTPAAPAFPSTLAGSNNSYVLLKARWQIGQNGATSLSGLVPEEAWPFLPGGSYYEFYIEDVSGTKLDKGYGSADAGVFYAPRKEWTQNQWVGQYLAVLVAYKIYDVPGAPGNQLDLDSASGVPDLTNVWYGLTLGDLAVTGPATEAAGVVTPGTAPYYDTNILLGAKATVSDSTTGESEIHVVTSNTSTAFTLTVAPTLTGTIDTFSLDTCHPYMILMSPERLSSNAFTLYSTVDPTEYISNKFEYWAFANEIVKLLTVSTTAVENTYEVTVDRESLYPDIYPVVGHQAGEILWSADWRGDRGSLGSFMSMMYDRRYRNNDLFHP